MSRLRSLAFFILALIPSTTWANPSSRTAQFPTGTEQKTTFEKEILPIFEKSCLACHSAQSPQSGLVLETVESLFQGGTVSGPAVIAGESSRSPLLLYLKGEKEPRMPLDAPLPEAEITLIARWIDQLKPAGQKEVETQLAGGITSDQDFEESIRPILEKNCFSCHNAETHRSGLVLETVESLLKGGGADGPAIVAGKSRESPLILHLRGDKAPRMPLEGVPLAEEKITRIASWIDGLEVSTIAQVKPKLDWPWIKLERPDVPQVQHQEWVTNPIDAFILAKLETKSLEPAPAASKRALLRRISFDLTGLPPTPEEMQRFLQDSSPNAYERQIDRLLASPHYGERWARHWLDLVHYGESRGGGVDRTYPHMWRYRDYVIRSFNQDRPYDRFIQQQIAGDDYRGYGNEGKIALGFLNLAVVLEGSGPVLRRVILTDMVDTVGTALLGMTVACARCHDHKFDPILQRDYYRMEAFFAPVTIGPTEVPFVDYELPKQHAKEWGERAKAWDQLLRKRKELGEKTSTQFKKRLEAIHFTRAFHDLKDMAVPVSGAELSRAVREKILFTKAEHDLFDLIGKHGGGFVNPNHPDRFKPMAYSAWETLGTENPISPATYLLSGGNRKLREEEMEPGFLSAVTGHSDPVNLEEGKQRRLLAEWISSPENPLTSRVMVNRIWQHHLGKGLVATPNDFGKNGSGTVHQDLVNWLACEFIDRGWRVKQVHRLILQSNLYRQSVRNPRYEEFEKIDPDNHYLWRMNPIRLEAEALRDSILAVSGQLNPLMGGPPFFPDVDEELLELSATWWEPSSPEERNRRSVYMVQQRSFVHPLMRVFDVANMNETCGARDVTTVTPQVFVLTNSQFVQQKSLQMAQRIVAQVGLDTSAQIERAFRLALQRPPSPAEKTESLAFLAQPEPLIGMPAADGSVPRGLEKTRSLALEESSPGRAPLADLCLVLFNMNEFIFLE